MQELSFGIYDLDGGNVVPSIYYAHITLADLQFPKRTTGLVSEVLREDTIRNMEGIGIDMYVIPRPVHLLRRMHSRWFCLILRDTSLAHNGNLNTPELKWN